MVLRRLWLACAVWALAGVAVAQPAPPGIVSASLTASASACGANAAGRVRLNVSGYAGAAIQVTGTWSGTLTFEASVDGTTCQALSILPTNSTTPATTTTSTGVWVASVPGYRYLSVRFSAFTSGTAVVTLQSSLASGAGVSAGGAVSTPIWVRSVSAATPTQSSVASSASNVTLLAANTSRLGATIYNDSTQVLYLKLGATASSTSYTAQLVTGAYYEVPFSYTGVIEGIWASANGNARITELAP